MKIEYSLHFLRKTVLFFVFWNTFLFCIQIYFTPNIVNATTSCIMRQIWFRWDEYSPRNSTFIPIFGGKEGHSVKPWMLTVRCKVLQKYVEWERKFVSEIAILTMGFLSFSISSIFPIVMDVDRLV